MEESTPHTLKHQNLGRGLCVTEPIFVTTDERPELSFTGGGEYVATALLLKEEIYVGSLVACLEPGDVYPITCPFFDLQVLLLWLIADLEIARNNLREEFASNSEFVV